MDDAKRLYIFNTSGNGSLAQVTGLPDVSAIGSFGKTPLADDGKLYMPVTTTDDQRPAIYVINPSTAVASKGTIVTDAESISAVGKLIHSN